MVRMATDAVFSFANELHTGGMCFTSGPRWLGGSILSPLWAHLLQAMTSEDLGDGGTTKQKWPWSLMPLWGMASC